MRANARWRAASRASSSVLSDSGRNVMRTRARFTPAGYSFNSILPSSYTPSRTSESISLNLRSLPFDYITCDSESRQAEPCRRGAYGSVAGKQTFPNRYMSRPRLLPRELPLLRLFRREVFRDVVELDELVNCSPFTFLDRAATSKAGILLFRKGTKRCLPSSDAALSPPPSRPRWCCNGSPERGPRPNFVMSTNWLRNFI